MLSDDSSDESLFDPRLRTRNLLSRTTTAQRNEVEASTSSANEGNYTNNYLLHRQHLNTHLEGHDYISHNLETKTILGESNNLLSL